MGVHGQLWDAGGAAQHGRWPRRVWLGGQARLAGCLEDCSCSADVNCSQKLAAAFSSGTEACTREPGAPRSRANASHLGLAAGGGRGRDELRGPAGDRHGGRAQQDWDGHGGDSHA